MCCNEKPNIIKDPSPFLISLLCTQLPSEAGCPHGFKMAEHDNLSTVKFYLLLVGKERGDFSLEPGKHSFL